MSMTLGIPFEVETCFACNVQFAMTSAMMAALRRSHATFYCPMGHAQHYTAKSDAEAERDRTNAAQARANEYQHALAVAQRKLEEEKAERARMERRIHRGVCPCCSRTFSNLAAHMKTKHPKQIAGKPKGEIAA
jgi:hypothetical protein